MFVYIKKNVYVCNFQIKIPDYVMKSIRFNKLLLTLCLSLTMALPLQPRLDKRITSPRINVEIIEPAVQDSLPNTTRYIPSGFVP